MNDKFWYVAVGGQQQGPWTQEEVLDGIRSGRYGRDAYVYAQGMANWVPITSQPDFQSAFGQAAAAPPPPPAALRGARNRLRAVR